MHAGAETAAAYRDRHSTPVTAALREIGVRDAAAGPTGRGVKVCVIDSGLDFSHPDFTARRFGQRLLVVRTLGGHRGAYDCHGHGTHTAGLACGPVTTEVGYRYGVAPGAHLYVARVFDDCGIASELSVCQAIWWAMSEGCDIAVLPFVFSSWSAGMAEVFADVTATALAGGMVTFAAAGNDGRLGWPRCEGIIAVGATDTQGRVASFSASDCTVYAPGVDVPSAWSRPVKYRMRTGTSMSAALAAGVGALWAEASGLRGRELRARVLAAASGDRSVRGP